MGGAWSKVWIGFQLLFGMTKPSKKAQWQSYVDDALLMTGQVTQAAIHGVDGMRWASSPDLKVGKDAVVRCTRYWHC